MAASVKRKKHLNLCNKKRKSMKNFKHADESIELSKSNMSKVNIDLLNEGESNVIAKSHSAPSTESLEHFDQLSVSMSPLLDQAQIKPADYSFSPILGNVPHRAINETNQVIVCETNDRMMTDKSPEKPSSKSAVHSRTSLSFNGDLSGALKYTNNHEVVGLSPVLDSSLLKIVSTPVNKKINCARNRAENINNCLMKSPILDSIHCRQSNWVHSTKKVNEAVSKSNTEVSNVPHNYFRYTWLESYAPSEAIITNASLNNCNTDNNIARNLSHNMCNSPENSKITFIQSHLEENKPTSPILDSVCRRKISSPQFSSPSIRSKKFINCSKDMMDDPRSSIDSSPKQIKTILNSCGELYSTSPQYSSENEKSCEEITNSVQDNKFISYNELSSPSSPILDSRGHNGNFSLQSTKGIFYIPQLLISKTNSNILLQENKNSNGTTSPVLGNEKYHQHIIEGSSISRSEQEISSLSKKQNFQDSFSSLKMQNSGNCMVKSSNNLNTCSTASIANTMRKTDMTFGPSLNNAGGDLTFERLMPDSSSKIISSNNGIAQKPSKDELNLNLAMADKSKKVFDAFKSKADDELQGFHLMDNAYIIDSSTKSINEWCLSNSANNVQRAKRKLDFDCAQNNLNVAIHSTEYGSSLKTENNEVKRKGKIRPQRGERLARSGKLKINRDEISYSENPPSEVLDKKHDIIIEEFDEDSPVKNNKDLYFRESQQKNLNDVVDSCLGPAKWAFSSQTGGKNLQNGRAKQNLKESDLDCLRSLDILELRANIEDDDLSQESVGSDGYKIECSTSPLTKSFEETQSEKNLEILSFPPALNVVSSNNIAKPVDILDSASKTRQSKSKRGSLSERLKRLLRSEKAEVNMFHHETHSSQHCGACLLRVNETTHVASRSILTCQYVSSQGSNCMDPQVQIFINPDFSKKITLGSNILIYPPWQTIWLEHHRVLLVFGVSKLRLSSEVSIMIRPSLSNAEFFLAQSFSCSPQTNEGCGCQREFMKQLFQASREPQKSAPAKFSVTAALSTLGPTDQVALKFKVLHSFSKRYKQEVLQCLICVDQDNCTFQLNLPTSVQDEKAVDILFGKSVSNTFLIDSVTFGYPVFIDRCEGLRSILSLLNKESSSQQLMCVVSPSPEWTVKLERDKFSCFWTTSRLLSLADAESFDGECRAECDVQVIALRSDQLFVWDQKADAYFKIKIDAAATIPNFAVRTNLLIQYLRSHHGLLTVDCFSTVTAKELGEAQRSPPIPPLATVSQPGDLVYLDAVVSRLSSDAQLRWEGACGHSLVRTAQTQAEPSEFFCPTCRQPADYQRQKIAMNVCAVVSDLQSPVRIKVKSETAQLLLDIPGELSSDKKYNMIRAIGASLKCMAIVVDVLKNPFGDILEFCVEEL